MQREESSSGRGSYSARFALEEGRAGTLTHDYKRHGTTTLFAALNTLDGSVIARCDNRHRHNEWLSIPRTDLRVPLGELKAQATAVSDGAVAVEIAERGHILRAVREANGVIGGRPAPPPASA